MAVVPWTYNNPRVDCRKLPSREFIFQGKLIEVLQDLNADIDLTKNTGLKLWDGAFLLARYMENNKAFPPTFWHEKRCVELGSGCGLVGIVAWLLGAKSILTDMPSSISHTERCVKVNIDRLVGCDPELADRLVDIEVKSYTWGDNVDDFTCPVDVVLGSDIVYNPEVTENLINSLRLLSGPQTVILISYKPRGLGEDVVFSELTRNGFLLEEVSKDYHPLDFQNSGYTVLKIVRSL